MKTTFKEFIFESKYNFADASRMDLIQVYLDDLKSDPELNIESPDTDDLLDPYDGYDKQTYIQTIDDNLILKRNQVF